MEVTEERRYPYRTASWRLVFLVPMFILLLPGLGSRASALPVCEGDDPPPICDPKIPADRYNPSGAFESIHRGPGGIVVSGWAVDPDSPSPIEVEVEVDGITVGRITADVPHPGRGAHGFDALVPVRSGSWVCVSAVNIGAGTGNTQLGCRAFAIVVDPFGAFEALTETGTTVQVRGWAIDPDTASPIDVHVYVDNVFTGGATAHHSRPDVAAAYPRYGDLHGYDLSIPASPAKGAHLLCIYTINTGLGANTQLGCKPYTVYGPPDAPSELVLTPNVYYISVWWRDNADDESGWRIERSQSRGAWTLIPDQGPTRSVGAYRGLTDRNLLPATNYCYNIVAWNAYGSSAAAHACTDTLRLPIAAPTSVTITGKGQSTISVTWMDNTTDEDKYEVSFWERTGPSGRIFPVSANPNTGPMSFTGTGLTPDTEYCVAIYALKAGHGPARTGGPCVWTDALPPAISSFQVSPSPVISCLPTPVQLSWRVENATRLKIFRNNNVIGDLSRTGTSGPWAGTHPGGVVDRRVEYRIAVGPTNGPPHASAILHGPRVSRGLQRGRLDHPHKQIEPRPVHLEREQHRDRGGPRSPARSQRERYDHHSGVLADQPRRRGHGRLN
jgi:hypothetical protein